MQEPHQRSANDGAKTLRRCPARSATSFMADEDTVLEEALDNL